MTRNSPSGRVAQLIWGVKQSFRSYVEAAGGVIDTDVARTSDGGFIFVADPDSDLILDPEGGLSGKGVFQGQVRFTAHGGMLSVQLTDLWLETGPTGASLSIAEPTYRLEVAKLGAMIDNQPAAMTLPTTITLDGYQWLGAHYPPGTVLDPVRLVLG